MAAGPDVLLKNGLNDNISLVWSATLDYSFNVLKIGKVFK